MRLLYIFLICFIACLSSQLNAQDMPVEEPPLLFDNYQIFLKEPVEKIFKIEYEKTGKPIKGHMTEDKESIILQNYNGKDRVKITYRDTEGQKQSMSKSKCFIDPYVPL